MKIETVKLASLKPDPKNARKHNEKNIDAIAASLKRFGQQKPITVDAKNVVIAGNGTLAAAKKLGWKEITIFRTELSGDEARAFAIADNRTAELAEWERGVLAETLLDFEKDLQMAAGFDDGDLSRALAEAATTGQREIEAAAGPAVANVDFKPTYEAKEATYTAHSLRQIILTYEGEGFLWVVEKLAALREKREVSENSSLILQLIEEAVGEKAPAGTRPEVAAANALPDVDDEEDFGVTESADDGSSAQEEA